MAWQGDSIEETHDLGLMESERAARPRLRHFVEQYSPDLERGLYQDVSSPYPDIKQITDHVLGGYSGKWSYILVRPTDKLTQGTKTRVKTGPSIWTQRK